MRIRCRVAPPCAGGGVVPSFRTVEFPLKGGRLTAQPIGWRRWGPFRWAPYLVGRDVVFTVRWERQSMQDGKNPLANGVYEVLPPLKRGGERQVAKLQNLEGRAIVGTQDVTLHYQSSVILDSGRCRFTLGKPDESGSHDLIVFDAAWDERIFFLLVSAAFALAGALVGAVLGAVLS